MDIVRKQTGENSLFRTLHGMLAPGGRVLIYNLAPPPAPPDKPFRVGLSVDVSIDVSNKRGPLLSSTLQRSYDEHSSGPGMSPERLQTQADPTGATLPGDSGQPVTQP